jgi:hypothetical protein
MGIFDKIVNYFGKTSKKANDKRYKANLEKIAASGPKGKKAVEDLMVKIAATDKAVEKANDLMKKADIYS